MKREDCGGAKLPSCSPDLLDRGGGGEGHKVCSLPSSLYLSWLTVNIWPCRLSFGLLHIFTLHPPLCSFSFFPLSPFLLLMHSLTLFYLSHFIFPLLLLLLFFTFYSSADTHCTETHAQHSDVNSYIKTSQSYPFDMKVCLFFYSYGLLAFHSVLLKCPLLCRRNQIRLSNCANKNNSGSGACLGAHTNLS